MREFALRWHNRIKWYAFAAIICWALSGITHPLMAWFGPQAAQFMPPRFQIQPAHIEHVSAVIAKHQLTRAHVAKLVPTAANEVLLQVTEGEQLPRRYFSLSSAEEFPDYDRQQAQWLASYYTGLDIETISDVRFRTKFDADYPRVNRLLPVYEVAIGAGEDRVSVFVYTETNSLAAINNQSKQLLQRVFQVLHTWSWLDVTGHGRVIIIALLMLTLMTIALSGIQLIFALPRRKIPRHSRRWHRRIAYVLWLPLLAWSASGFYHLLQAQYVQPVAGVRLGPVMNLQHWLLHEKSVSGNAEISAGSNQRLWRENFSRSLGGNVFFNAASLVMLGEGQYAYRLSISSSQSQSSGKMHDHGSKREQRFDGQSKEKGAIYLAAHSAQRMDISDAAQATYLVKQLFSGDVAANGKAEPEIADITLVTHFGPDYDFRNKRLPVWQIDLINDDRSRVFIDPASNILVDQNRKIDRLESLSFSLLHKWNLLVPFTGRKGRDMLVVMTLLTLMLIAGFGAYMTLRHKPSR